MGQAVKPADCGESEVVLQAAKARRVKLGGRPENLKNVKAGQDAGHAKRTEIANARAPDLRGTIEAIWASVVTSATGIA